MSTSGTFQLLSNTGIQDKLLMASDFLENRVKALSRENKRKAQQEYLDRVEEAAKEVPIYDDDGNLVEIVFDEKKYIAEFNQEYSWSPNLTQIEKTHSVFVNASYKPFAAMAFEYHKTNSNGPKFGSTSSFNLQQRGTFYSDMVVHVQLSGLTSVDPGDKVRYVSFLGHKIFSKIEYSINNTVLDSYTPDEMNAYYNFHVPANKKSGWLRCVGQEIPTLGHVTADPTVDENREYRWFGDGPQTFKFTHETVDLWIPLLFWFKDIKNAMPSMVIPQGQNKIKVTFNDESELISFAVMAGTGAFTSPVITKCDLYTNHIYMLPIMFDLFIKNYGFSLIRVHKKQTKILNDSKQSIKLNDLKWPIENIYVAFRPTINNSLSQHWHQNSALTTTFIPVPVSDTLTVSINSVVLQKESPTVDTISIKAHGIELYTDIPTKFFSSYIPSHYGKHMSTPEDSGWFMIPFCFKPGEHNPSGHINLSRVREFYLEYTSSFISTTSTAEMIVLADCLNFLLVKDGSATLRFST
jgi:hypothetical protein